MNALKSLLDRENKKEVQDRATQLFALTPTIKFRCNDMAIILLARFYL